MSTTPVLSRIINSIKRALPKGLKTAWWLIKITVPVSFAVMLMDHYGILNAIAQVTSPAFQYLGLPGVSAIVLITSIFTNIYSVVAVLTLLDLPMREGIILATMCLVSHGFIIETAVMKKTGSSAVGMMLVRLAGSIAVALILNMVMPGTFTAGNEEYARATISINEALMNWVTSIGSTVGKIFILVNLLLIFQQILEEFGWIKLLEKPLSLLMKSMGLPGSTTFSWVVANLVGLAYGSAIMIDQREKNRMSAEDADLLNHHVSISHSQLEDPLLFMTLGYALHWLIWPRILVAFFSVWLRRAYLHLKAEYVNSKLQQTT